MIETDEAKKFLRRSSENLVVVVAVVEEVVLRPIHFEKKR